MTNNWAQAQEGTGVLFRSAVDSGEQAVVEDIVFENNIMRSSGSAVNIFGGEGKGGTKSDDSQQYFYRHQREKI